MHIDADFPGGNIILDDIRGDDVFLRQDLRDTHTWWFYWCFRATGAAGRKLTFHFGDGDVIGSGGPAISMDGGLTWQWAGTDAVQDATFTYEFAPDAHEVRFCFAIPYLEQDLGRFLKTHENSPYLQVGALCETRKGRDAEKLLITDPHSRCKDRILLTCRHHCCEMMASHALEGILSALLGDDDEGARLRDGTEWLVIPFMDKDGVEDGDQGKNRAPRDHNRDYDGSSFHLETAALRELAPSWSEGRWTFAMDMHCPYIRGGMNEDIYFVGMEPPEQWKVLKKFSEILAWIRTGPLPYNPDNNLAFGVGWNTRDNFAEGKSFARWAFEQPGVGFSGSIEVPYAIAGGVPVTASTARALGIDLARAIREFLDRR